MTARAPRPVLVFDGDCAFCRLWIERWRAATGEAVDYRPYQDDAGRHPEIPRARFAEAIHFFEPERTSRAAEAVLRSLAYAPGLAWLPRVYAVSLAAAALEAGYRFVAARRPFFARVTRLLWGTSVVPPPLDRTSRLVLAGLGLCYLAAFLSLGAQIQGLIGSKGIMPAAPWLEAAKSQLGAARFWLLPTAAWLSASDFALTLHCGLGAVASLGLILGVAVLPSALLCWALYLSLCCVGADFLSFQWDALLLEAGLIACFLPRRGAVWLLRLLLLKLMLHSGLVKIFSGDPSWRDLSALAYHYWTQPLPTPLAWWFDRLPLWAQKASCLAMFVVELAAPVLIIFPRRVRAVGALMIGLLMSAIALTGNYGFFNVLTIVLCLSCLDDRFFKSQPELAAPKARTRSISFAVVAFISITTGFFETLAIAGIPPPTPARALTSAVSPLRSFNSYGLFAVMTKSRDEIVIEVSPDGRDWFEWPFRYKPSDPRRAPPIVAPHMPRLDWQCWFAALGESSGSPWFGNLLFRLLEGSAPATRLLGPSPLAGGVPLYARAVRYEVRFAPPGSGAWWTRERKGLFFPVVSLKR